MKKIKIGLALKLLVILFLAVFAVATTTVINHSEEVLPVVYAEGNETIGINSCCDEPPPPPPCCGVGPG